MSHFNHLGRPGKVGGSLPKNNLSRLFLILKGSSTSGNYGHAGRPGKKGGSGPNVVSVPKDISVGSFTGSFSNGSKFPDSDFLDVLNKMPSVASQVHQVDIGPKPPDWAIEKLKSKGINPSGVEGLYDQGRIYVNTMHWLYKKATSQDIQERLLHEMSHRRFYQRSDSEDKGFTKAAKEIMSKRWDSENVESMFKYALDSQERNGFINEFFPEIVRQYAFNGDVLKKELPDVYNFAQEIMTTVPTKK